MVDIITPFKEKIWGETVIPRHQVRVVSPFNQKVPYISKGNSPLKFALTSVCRKFLPAKNKTRTSYTRFNIAQHHLISKDSKSLALHSDYLTQYYTTL